MITILQNIDPSRGAQYSPNLYKWVKKYYRRYGRTAEALPYVYRSKDGELWIGRLFEGDGSIIGCRLISVLCNGAKEETFNHISVRELEHQVDFWDRYMEVGRCAIDAEHSMYFVGDDSRWSRSSDTRSCLWCGNHTQKLFSWAETNERSEWRAA